MTSGGKRWGGIPPPMQAVIFSVYPIVNVAVYATAGATSN